MSQELNTVVLPLDLNAVQSGDRIVILPMGEISGRDGRAWTLPPDDAGAVVAELHDCGLDIPVDFDHQTAHGGGPAAGWLSQFEVETDGITAVVTWNQAGEEAVAKRTYRYLSPGFYSSGKKVLKIHSVGLTNTPNIPALPALNHQQEIRMDPTQLTARVAELELENARLKAEVEMNATKTQQLETNAATEKKGLLEQVATLQAEIAKRDADAAMVEINAVVDAAVTAGKIAPAQRDTLAALGKHDRAAMEKLIQDSPLDLNMLKQVQGKVPERSGDASTGLAEHELAVCSAMGVDPEKFKQTNLEG